MIRCNNCMSLFKDEDDLKIIEDDGEYINACPHCETDSYLMDVHDSKTRVKLGELAHKLNEFLYWEGTDISNGQYKFLHWYLLHELCKAAIELGEDVENTQDILDGNC